MGSDVFRILEGDDFELALPDGSELRAQAPGGAAVTVEAEDGAVEIAAPAKGVHYLATRESEGSRWLRLGELHVEALVDEIIERLRSELAALNERVTAVEAIQVSVTDPSGTEVTRVGLVALRRQRALAEARLADALRRRRGDPPVRMR